MPSSSLIASLSIVLLCAVGCRKPSPSRSYSEQEQAHFDKILGKQKPELHLSSEEGKIDVSDLQREPITPNVHHNGCVRTSHDTAIIRNSNDQLAAHRLRDGALIWTHEQPGARLLSCTSQGVMIMQGAYGGDINLLDYDSGATLKTQTWAMPSLSGYSCGELRTLPLPGDRPGFAWQLTPTYSHGGRAPSPEAVEQRNRARCCMRGTTRIIDDALKSTTHEHHTGKAYGRDGHRCDMMRSGGVDEAKQLDERKIGRDLGVLLSFPEELKKPFIHTAIHDEFTPGHVLFTQYVHKECSPGYARTGIAIMQQDSTWSASWSTEGLIESFCPIP
jgi:hypothetical protein